MAKRKSSPQKFNRIAEELEAQGKTQAWLAGELGVEYRTINRYANNHRQPSIEILFQIAKILRIGPGELLNEN
jgi:transcriptional regulator with XRE-family HTH domain